MEQQQKELRRAAAQAFAESLDQLQKTLQESKPPVAAPAQPEPPTPTMGNSASALPTLADWEAAVADIEQFIETRQAD
ncbi:MAG TPA: hypothetical protein V6C63_15555 [Allocoleopsis sp.]